MHLNRDTKKMRPGDMEVMYCLATLYVKDRRLSDAKKILSESLALKPTYIDAANLLEEVEKKLALEEGEQELAHSARSGQALEDGGKSPKE